jgi:predicted secreted protein
MTVSQRSPSLTSLKILCFVLSLSVLAGVSHSKETETVIVSKAFHGREIKVRAGGFIRINLNELGAAGYAWSIKDLNVDHFEIVSVRTEGPPPPGDTTGAPVVRTWLIRTKKPGKSELKFLYYRPWEGEEKAADRFFLNVRIL